MNKQAIIIGATGAVGSALLQLLITDKNISNILVFSRRPLSVTDQKLTTIITDFANLAQYQDKIQGDILYSCLGTTKAQAGSIAQQRIIDVDYQFTFAKLAANNGVRHYVLVSSAGANANSTSPYLAMKGELEQQVTQLGFKSTHIIQPSLLLAHRTQFRMGEWLASILMPIICILPGLQKYRPIAVTQVAKKMHAVAAEEITGIHYHRLAELFN